MIINPSLYRAAFGDDRVTADRTARALAQFLRPMVSFQSHFDEGRAKARTVRADFENFSPQENRGKTLFLSHYANCHMHAGQDAHFFPFGAMNNGLDADLNNSDGGVGDRTLNPSEMGLFKSSSLRNIELTAPYMHDGRFATLEAVVDHYSGGLKDHPNLERRVRRRLRLSGDEMAALITFLKTLTDPGFISDPKFSDPFR